MNKIPSYKTMFKPARDQVRDLINSNPELDDDELTFLNHISDKRTITLKQGLKLHYILSGNEVA